MPLFCGWFSSQSPKQPPEPTVENLKIAYSRLLDPDYRQYSQDAEDALEQVEAYLTLRQHWLKEFSVDDRHQIVASWKVTGRIPERYTHTKTWSLVQEALKCAVELDANVYPIALANGWKLTVRSSTELREIEAERAREAWLRNLIAL